MRKKIAIILMLIVSSGMPVLGHAVDTLRIIQTGLNVLDAALNDMSRSGQTTSGAIQMAATLADAFGFSNSLTNSLRRQGYNDGEIYYLGLLHRQTGRSIEYLLKNKPKGMGWGELAHRLGVHPSALNKARVALKKKEKSGFVVQNNSGHDQPHPKYGKTKGHKKGKGHKKK